MIINKIEKTRLKRLRRKIDKIEKTRLNRLRRKIEERLHQSYQSYQSEKYNKLSISKLKNINR